MDTVKTNNNRPTPEEAREVLMQGRKEREEAALSEFEQFIAYWEKKHNCRLDVAMMVTMQGNIPKLQIVAK